MKLFLGLPTYGQVEQEVLKTVVNATKKPMNLCTRPSSMLTDNFNVLWCDFMNGDYTHFAMLHADISAENWWMDKLLDLMQKNTSDVLSVVMPIKDTSGDTSTAFIPNGDSKVKRLSLAEIQKLPEVFGSKEVSEFVGMEGTLLVNTGLFIVKRGEWCKKFKGFRCVSEILFDEKWKARRVSEDWIFSMDAKDLGLTVHATRSIRATHIGKQVWRNYIE